MNIDYDAIAREVATNLDGKSVSQTNYAKAIIEAYEAQKAPPEWVPLDLDKVQQGQEVRYAHWSSDVPPVLFVGTYGRSFVTDNGLGGLSIRGRLDWLMRAPKPKTVRVKVYHLGGDEYVASIGGEPVAYKIVGEGDIEVTE